MIIKDFKILEIDLTSRAVGQRTIDEGTLRKYLSGSGLGAKILYEEFDNAMDPYDENSPIVILPGLLVGTTVPTASKTSFMAKSPLTGIWGESHVGGFWGAQLMKTDYKGIIITGKSEEPVYICVENDKVTIESAEEIWGKGTYETSDYIRSIKGDKTQVASIGVGGENLVKIAGIMIGGLDARAAARCGLGAVFGSKKLKAIAVRGTKPVVPEHRDDMIKNLRERIPAIQANTVGLLKFGTPGGMVGAEEWGDLPINNWRDGEWKSGVEKINGQVIRDEIYEGDYGCAACVIKCGKKIKLRTGQYKGDVVHAPEYETLGALASNIMNEDLDTLAEANNLCNIFGLDTICMGNVLAMAFECYEKGLIKADDCGGLELEWGSRDAILGMIEKIANRDDIGNIFAEGAENAGRLIGGLAPEYAIHTKGLTYPYHDPRAFTSMAVNYATANRGADHLAGPTFWFEKGHLDSREILGTDKTIDYDTNDNKGQVVAIMQDYMNALEALGLCIFVVAGKTTVDHVAEWVRNATGWDVDGKEILEAGERVHNIKRLYNVDLGISRKNDILPPRLMSHDRRTGGAAGRLPHVGFMLNEYYEARGWNEEGIPKEDRLTELGIELKKGDGQN